jgi:hypothetical protein
LGAIQRVTDEPTAMFSTLRESKSSTVKLHWFVSLTLKAEAEEAAEAKSARTPTRITMVEITRVASR